MIIPMAVEETSIIAASSKTAKWIRDHGKITTETIGDVCIGQVQIAKIKNFEKLEAYLRENKQSLIDILNIDVANGLVARGGGVRDMHLRTIERGDGHLMGVIHVLINTCDAMGANIINQVCEYLKTPIEMNTDETVNMCILSNLNDQKLTRATIRLRNIDKAVGEKLEEASLFAELDPYRAATNNKGVLNGMDAVLVATGNDWRAVEAGVHAYAVRNGQYRSLTKWRMDGNDLIGVIEAPICVGIVGGVTQLHPAAKIALRILGVSHADELARIIAAVGLVQNLGALRALITVGIIEGHMKLHIDNLLLVAGATDSEMPELKERLQSWLITNKRVSLNNACELLIAIRQAQAAT
jgi:hydroxymethylglutaryl-CoA reductase